MYSDFYIYLITFSLALSENLLLNSFWDYLAFFVSLFLLLDYLLPSPRYCLP